MNRNAPLELTVQQAMSLHTFGIETPIDGDKLGQKLYFDKLWKRFVTQDLRFLTWFNSLISNTHRLTREQAMNTSIQTPTAEDFRNRAASARKSSADGELLVAWDHAGDSKPEPMWYQPSELIDVTGEGV